ncbi:MAG: HEAT repeat domain-containing protein [Candidatus Asgardarchaeia archaeon]
MIEQAIDEIFKWAKSRSPWLKQCGIEALSELGDERAYQIFIENLKNQNPDIRYYSLKGLFHLGKPSAAKHILEMLEVEEDDDLIQRAKDVLLSLVDRSIYTDLLPFLKSKKPIVRGIVCELLGTIKESKAVPYLINLLSDKNKEVKKLAAEAIGNIGDRQAGKLIINLIEKHRGNYTFIEGAIWALGELKETRAEKILIELASNGNPEIRVSAIWALGKLRSVNGLSVIFRGLSDKNVDVRYESVISLGKIRDSEAIPYLLDALDKESDEEVKVAIIETLVKLNNSKVIPAIIKQLDVPSVNVKIASITAIRKLGAVEAIPRLLNLLKDEDDLVREAARTVLTIFKRKYFWRKEKEEIK